MYNLETFLLYAPPGLQPIAAHSIYFQVLGEHGWVGLSLFVALWIMVWRKAAALRREAKGRDEYRWVYHLSGMIQVSLVGYAVGGAFLSLAYFDLPYNILVVVLVIQRWLAAQVAAASEGSAAGSGSSVRQPARGDARA
jgi:probable O-glycosylation ligase (exosortase A-associated)